MRTTDTPKDASKSTWSFGRHLFLAAMTGGLSLVFSLGCKLPSLWETTCLLRAEWIQNGRDPRNWKWIGRGWLAAAATFVVLFPAALFLTAGLSLLFPQAVFMHTPGMRLPPVVLFAALVPMSALAVIGALAITWSWHTGRQAIGFIWATTYARLTRSSS